MGHEIVRQKAGSDAAEDARMNSEARVREPNLVHAGELTGRQLRRVRHPREHTAGRAEVRDQPLAGQVPLAVGRGDWAGASYTMKILQYKTVFPGRGRNTMLRWGILRLRS